MIPDTVYAETLLQFLAPVRHFLQDPMVSEVMINGPNQVYVERRGRLERADVAFDSPEAIFCALRNAAQFVGKEVDERNPVLEARLPDGSRLQAVVPPAAPLGPYVSIRRFSNASFTPARLVEFGTLTADACRTLEALVRSKFNVIVAGGTGSGKTSFLNMLTRFVPEGERIVVIEDSKEVQVQHEHAIYLEARPKDPDGYGAVSIRDLFRATLRMRPDRIIIGEIRGGEALDIVQAMVSGHGGCLTTLHATHPRDTLTRLETMAMMSDVDMPLLALKLQIASGVNFIVQVGRAADGSRKVTHISEVLGVDLQTGKYQLEDLFVRRFSPAEKGAASSDELIPTGYLPSQLEQIQSHDCQLPQSVLAAAAARHSTEQGEDDGRRDH